MKFEMPGLPSDEVSHTYLCAVIFVGDIQNEK